MSMLTLNGQVLNVFDSPASTDKATGEVRPAASRVQILAENELQNGQKRQELVNLKVEDPHPYREGLGRTVRVPVGAFVASGAVLFFALKGQRPEFPDASATGRGPDGGAARPAGGSRAAGVAAL
ncbi:MAG: hypothetical protein Q8L56_03105 [Rhodocyclaceae bacterium]|nr:hypothetical protein [Rhodocyclaceae bacterium]